MAQIFPCMFSSADCFPKCVCIKLGERGCAWVQNWWGTESSHPLDLEVHTDACEPPSVCGLGTKLESCARILSSPNLWALSSLSHCLSLTRMGPSGSVPPILPGFGFLKAQRWGLVMCGWALLADRYCLCFVLAQNPVITFVCGCVGSGGIFYHIKYIYSLLIKHNFLNYIDLHLANDKIVYLLCVHVHERGMGDWTQVSLGSKCLTHCATLPTFCWFYLIAPLYTLEIDPPKNL